MMPSRGASALRGIAPHIRLASQSRSFSLARSFPRNGLAVRATHKRIPVTASVIGLSAYARNASTNSTVAPIDTITPGPPSPVSPSVPNLDTLTLDNIDFSAEALAGIEHLGYLKELGIDYGWGITSTFQWFIEHMHITLGLPWWGSIAMTAAVVRLVTLPLTIRASDSAAKQVALAPVLRPFQARMEQYKKERNVEMMQVEMSALMAARREAGISIPAMLVPPLVQAIVGYCGFRLMYKMSEMPVPGLRDGGFLWLTDLTQTDGYLLMPALMAVSMHLLARLGSETGSAQLSGGMQKFMLYGMPAIIFVITGFQSGALCVWFAASGGLSMITGLALKQDRVRRMLNITPMYKTNTPSAGNSMFGVNLGGSSTPAPSPALSPKLPGYSRPMYQAPTIASQPKTIDTTLAPSSKASTSITGKLGNSISSFKKQFTDVRSQLTNSMAQQRLEKMQKTKTDRSAAAAEKAVEARKARARR